MCLGLNQLSTKEINERAISGVTNELMKLNDVVTKRAKHCDKYQNISSKILTYETPKYSIGKMVKYAFMNVPN